MQLVLFEVPPEGRGSNVIPFDFDTHCVRVVLIKGEPWWVASDVCRALEIGNASLAVNGRPDRPDTGLDEDERGIATVNTPSGEQEMLVVSLSGLFSLVLVSRKPEAKRFKKWVTSEVLPSILKTGSFSVGRPSRVLVIARRNKCDVETAKVRNDQYIANKAAHQKFAEQGAKPRDFQDWHNSAYLGGLGKKAPEIRQALGIKRGTIIDRMSRVPMTINLCAKAIAERLADDALQAGRPMTHSARNDLLKTITEEMTIRELGRFGADAALGIQDDPVRGPIVDVIRLGLG